MAFHVGQLVVCVDDRPTNIAHLMDGAVYPIKGCVYTIRGFHPDRDAIWLEEIANPVREYEDGWYELAWLLRRFRPLTRRNIEIVEALKAPPPADVEPLSPLEVAFQ